MLLATFSLQDWSTAFTWKWCSRDSGILCPWCVHLFCHCVFFHPYLVFTFREEQREILDVQGSPCSSNTGARDVEKDFVLRGCGWGWKEHVEKTQPFHSTDPHTRFVWWPPELCHFCVDLSFCLLEISGFLSKKPFISLKAKLTQQLFVGLVPGACLAFWLGTPHLTLGLWSWKRGAWAFRPGTYVSGTCCCIEPMTPAKLLCLFRTQSLLEWNVQGFGMFPDG